MSDPTSAPANNVPEFSVGELSTALQRTVETAFARVRVRGEVSGFKRPASGHLYFALKDADAVLDACCWKPQARLLTVALEDGMEVIAIGRLTTYAGRSKYQMIVERVELAGKGALLALIEERRRRLAAEGLFDAARKKAPPYLPRLIGVVTSPTGAVIRDILHRLAERFPRPVLVWPVLVQGEGSAAQVAAAIAGFNRLQGAQRPDLLIVARGGGSIEDLMAFNDEGVVRAAAASEIPLISAIGHETDTTLIDFAADRRAPTPTAAAEMAVPVRAEVLARVLEAARRLPLALERSLADRRLAITALARGLGDPHTLIGHASQRLEDRAARLDGAIASDLVRRRQRLDTLSAALPHPRAQVALARARADAAGRALTVALANRSRVAAADQARDLDRLTRAAAALDAALKRVTGDRKTRAESLGRVLEGFSYRATLARGYAVVRDAEGRPVAEAEALPRGAVVSLEFHDGSRAATLDAAGPPRPAARKAASPKIDQGSLL